MISQLTVFLENQEGSLAAATRVIAQAGINMRAMNIADTSDFGILRVICDHPQKAADALEAAGCRAVLTPVTAVKIANEQGGLAKVLEILDDKGVNIEYGYCFGVNDEYAVDILKIRNEAIEAVLAAAGITVLTADQVYEV